MEDDPTGGRAGGDCLNSKRQKRLCHQKWHYKGLSRVRGNQHARFLWELRPVTGVGLPGQVMAKIILFTLVRFRVVALKTFLKEQTSYLKQAKDKKVRRQKKLKSLNNIY